MSSKFLQIRPNNVPADNKIQFEGIPVISFSIGSQGRVRLCLTPQQSVLLEN